MSELVYAIVLGIIQGLTEFLPVSSSGHLEIAKYLFGDRQIGEESLLMTVTLHAATALSTLLIFRKDVAKILSGLFQKEWNAAKDFSFKVILSMIPAALIGFFFEDLVSLLFEQRIILVGSMLLITALLLYFADMASQTHKKVGIADAIIIGLSQAFAIMPGISRSGATISTSVLLGIDRYQAARFSFLMVVPLILGKMAYDMTNGELMMARDQWWSLGIGFVSAFIAGAVACKWMIALVQRSQLKYFSFYCILIGLIAILTGLKILPF